VEENKL
jgi:calcium-dependent protein kinase